MSSNATHECGCDGRPILLHRKVPQQPECLLGTQCEVWDPPWMWAGPQGAASMGRPGLGADAAYAAPKKSWGPLECPQQWMHTLRSVHNHSCSLPANENSCDRAVGCPCSCMLWQAGPVMQTGAPAVFLMARACCVAWMLF